MKLPFSPNGAMANVSNFEEAHQEGDRGRPNRGDVPTKEELVILEQPIGSQRHPGKSTLTLDQEATVTKRSTNPSGRVEGGQRGEAKVETQPRCQHGGAGRSHVYQEDQDVSRAFQEFRRVRVEASDAVDEAKKAQEEDRSRQNTRGYYLVFGYSINAVLEP